MFYQKREALNLVSRPTIADLAKAANVSVSTVDRVINARDPVRGPTAERVRAAAEAIGFHAAGLIGQRLIATRLAKTLGFLLLQKSRPFYQFLAHELAEATRTTDLIKGSAKILHLDDFEPAVVAAEIERLGKSVDAIAVVAANHPRVSAAITTLQACGVPVFSLISELTAEAPVGYAGLDNFKVGRTAAWAITNICKAPAKVAIIVGSHRFRCQDLNEMGFRSFFREHAPGFTILEPLSSLEDARYAAEITRDLLVRHPDLSGLYVAGGGISGVIGALREVPAHRKIVTVGHDLTPQTRAGLIDGVIKLIIAHPVKALAEELVEAMAKATLAPAGAAVSTLVLPFDLLTSENA